MSYPRVQTLPLDPAMDRTENLNHQPQPIPFPWLCWDFQNVLKCVHGDRERDSVCSTAEAVASFG